MSVFDLPRVHFAGVAVTRLPTGPRAGLLDLETNRAVTGDGVFDTDRPAAEYHDFLAATAAQGTNFAGNGHFWIDAKVVGCELAAGVIDVEDMLVGRQLEEQVLSDEAIEQRVRLALAAISTPAGTAVRKTRSKR